MRFAVQAVGQWTEEQEFAVEPARVRAYADATNDEHPAHRAGTAAPPLFAVVPMGPQIDRAVGGLIADEDRRWGVHGAQDMHFHAMLVPGMVVRTRAAVIGVAPRPLGTTAVIKTEMREGDRLLNEAYVTLVFRRKSDVRPAGRLAPDHRTPAHARAEARAAGRVVEVVRTVDPDQTYRYAEASGDRNPIHLDPELARSVGLPGIILHGMCTMAFAAQAVIGTVGAGQPERLRRLATRFARPVLPGQAITTRIWEAGAHDGRLVFGFETLNPDGKAVLVDGLAEIATV